MSIWVAQPINCQVDGTALANSSSATSILPGAAVWSMPANTLLIGTEIVIHAAGRISTLATTPGTLTLDIRFGAVIVATSQAITLNTTAQTNATWLLDWTLTCRAIGSSTSANMMHAGVWMTRAALGSQAVATSGPYVTPIPDTAPAVGTGFDSTVANAVNLFGTWSSASASNSIQVHQFRLQIAGANN